jgi:hypothetical protein
VHTRGGREEEIEQKGGEEAAQVKRWASKLMLDGPDPGGQRSLLAVQDQDKTKGRAHKTKSRAQRTHSVQP